MDKKNLVLLCDNYPYSSGEFFIDDEMRIIAPLFEKIYVITPSQKNIPLNRFIPENTTIITHSGTITLKDKLITVPNILQFMFWNELFRAIFKYKIRDLKMVFKIMFMDLVRAKKIKSIIKKTINDNQINTQNSIFYSYWHDYKALALSMLKKKKNQIKSISRAHRWDVFAERNLPPYLPYKHYILNHLTQTFSISQAGNDKLQEYTQTKEKIKTSKLGKINKRTLNMNPSKNNYLICSCSNIIAFKRVDKIIEVLKNIKINGIKWIHFGDGKLRKKIQILAERELKNIKFEFKGIVPNNEILDYYCQNYVNLFINLSESEGIPVSIMEALSAGIPVLATDVGGTAEAVNDNHGFLVPKDFNVANVVKIIEDYLTSDTNIQKNLRLNAFNFWKENYNAEKNYTKFVEDILKL